MTIEQPTTVGAELLRLYPDSSGRTRKQMLRDGRVRVNRQVVGRADAPLAPGNRVEVVSARESARAARPALPGSLHLLHEDEDVLVVDKPVGLLTIATLHEKEKTAYAYLRAHLKAADPRAKVFIVHRLDRLASGLLVFACNPEAKAALQDQLRDHSMERLYVVVVAGRVAADEGKIEVPLIEDVSGRVRAARGDEGKEAVTHFRTLARGQRTSTLEVRLETGRKHQIRVHLAGLGHAILGDPVYGAGPVAGGRMALHAQTLGFDHPGSRQRLVFQSPAPAHFRALAR